MSAPKSPRSSFGRTPESGSSGLKRKDSKHALTTCHGTTASGRACRKPLTSSDARYTIKGTILIPHKDQDPAVFFCHLHKDQAAILIDQKKKLDGLYDVDAVQVEERTSLETVFRNLGLEQVPEEDETNDVDQSCAPRRPSRTTDIPAADQRDEHNRSSRPRRVIRGDGTKERPLHLSPPPPSKRAPPTTVRKHLSDDDHGCFRTLFSCLLGGETYSQGQPRRRRYISPNSSPRRQSVPSSARRSRRTSATTSQGTDKFGTATAGNTLSPANPSHGRSGRRDSDLGASSTKHIHLSPEAARPRRKSDTLKVYRDSITPTRPTHSASNVNVASRKPLAPRTHSAPEQRQGNILKWTPACPSNATDTTRLCYAKLITAMSEPPTSRDAEGYIYMFWQTELETTDDETTAAASIMGAPKSQARTKQDEAILQRRFFQTSANSRMPDLARRTIFLKIGRAANVHQRMGQWTKQCGYPITLLRYYPQLEDKKVRFVGKVERLVHLHLEMLGHRVKKSCTCGTEHREWFEIEATTAAVKEVDGIIDQWVRWCEARYEEP